MIGDIGESASLFDHDLLFWRIAFSLYHRLEKSQHAASSAELGWWGEQVVTRATLQATVKDEGWGSFPASRG